jgi:amino acid transporter
VLLYSFVGVDLPSTAGEEIRDPRRDIPVAVVVTACTVFHLTSRRPT